MLLEDSPGVLSLGFFLGEEMGYSYEWKRERVSVLIRDGQVIRCKSEKHVPIGAVSKEPRIPDGPSKASGDRLQIPGARSSGDRSRKVLQSDVPGWENPGQASSDRLHFPGVQAPRDGSHKVPGRLQLFQRRFLW